MLYAISDFLTILIMLVSYFVYAYIAFKKHEEVSIAMALISTFVLSTTTAAEQVAWYFTLTSLIILSIVFVWEKEKSL
jgi:hypothetical protein